jgi:hypothetical protein
LTESPISETSILSQAGNVIATEVDGEAIIMTIERGQCYGFDAIGTRIWSLIERPTRFGDVCATLLGEYDIDHETCRQDVARLLSELFRERLIVVDNEQGR